MAPIATNPAATTNAAPPNLAQPLPRAPGPKLAAFMNKAYHADIEFIEELGGGRTAADSRVWKVNIDGSGPYALKLFYFVGSRYLRRDLAAPLNRPLPSDNDYFDYFDPFHCECRAYGRLKEAESENLAVRALGYLFLTADQEAQVSNEIEAYVNSDEIWERTDEHDGAPIRAIVKELVEGDPFQPEHVSVMWDDLERLHELGILVRDVRILNYINGKLIDFSRAWTAPTPAFEYIRKECLEEERRKDPEQLHGAIFDYGRDPCQDWDTNELMPDELWDCVGGSGTDKDPRN
ncbi:kinetochore Sim4 complex subunit FTA2-domain-containing protein [Diplogelasinospora grovesii]|uniref:Kinetochore Sim4 complex subunit FTA2-domain-containing protein n=1 Tax=Diplogelasinospora grovesii TaxID=303347 RepID=A0AAN6N2N0_9PEZI|nr:kinetochore Sim4 complex subunit FTA2-domain-containing protein [Diplogelasinospora grovesii]